MMKVSGWLVSQHTAIAFWESVMNCRFILVPGMLGE